MRTIARLHAGRPEGRIDRAPPARPLQPRAQARNHVENGLMSAEDFPTGNNKADDDLLDVGDLVRLFEESEDSSYDARKQAERDRDYFDHKQWTDSEVATLEKRGQPVVTANRIAPKINFLIGLEKDQRIDPRVLPRTPAHEQDADAARHAQKYAWHTE